MFGCAHLTVEVATPTPQVLLDDANVSFAAGGLHAIVGPSGCGKTTLVKAMLGLLPHTGSVFFNGEEIFGANALVGRVGFAPQFSIAPARLSVRECLVYTYRLAVADQTGESARIDEVLQLVGLDAHADKVVQSLSGGQLRRLGLAQELMADPPVLVCDEVTSGLDPVSEDAILKLLREICARTGKTVVCIIHNLEKLPQFDSVAFLYAGRVLFQGPMAQLCAHMGVQTSAALYAACAQNSPEYWAKRAVFLAFEPPLAQAPAPAVRPGLRRQCAVMLERRFKLFFRDTGTLLLTLTMAVGFPLIVILFAWDGLPQLEQIGLTASGAFLELMQEKIRYAQEAASVSLLVTGLILFQITLLGLMASNNGSREIAGERALYEKERLIGVRPAAYMAAKFAYVTGLSVFQGLLMLLLVKYVCVFPGSVWWQGLLLVGSTVSMSFVCLGFSALASSAEKSSLLSIYLVGFQLPLSGVILALPHALEWVFRPFINAYWTWSGAFATMKETAFYDAFRFANDDWGWIPSPALAIGVLALQALAGVLCVWIGCARRRWN